MVMRYGFIGLGNLGGAMALRLANAGFDLTVHDLDQSLAAPLIAAGATWAENPAAVGARSDAVFTCLPSPAVSERVLTNLLSTLPAGAAWVETSTLGRDDIVRLAEMAAAKGVRVLECPVTGGVHLAAEGKITALVGGDADLMAAHLPALKVISSRQFHMGPVGAAAVIKVITNMLAFIHLQSCSEALMLAKRGGLDLAQSWAAIAASSGTSFVHETEGQLILNGSYDIAFSIDLALKDLGFAMAFGRQYGVPLDLAALTTQKFVAAKVAYGGEAPSSQLAKLLEDQLGTDLRAPGFPARLGT
jgi:3-hydroxyisobutyrate dehydrogenase